MSTVTVNVDDRLVRLVRSRLFGVVAALQGVSITFAPAFLYWSGQRKFLRYEWLVVPLCFAMIFLIPLVFFRLGNAIVVELRKT